ncbi:MAG: hypothetical protein J5767_11760 [Paludibacteraceae bacterium]|nr:hypothetical protein [Paludibacteraceae bacterium]
MKKSLLFILLFVFSTSFVACSKEDDDWLDDYTNEIQWVQESAVEEHEDGNAEENNNLDSIYITKIQFLMPQQPSSPSLQGAALWGDYVFQCENYNSRLTVYNIREKTYLGEIPLAYNKYYHDNQAAFSSIYYEQGDEFPLLYISQIYLEAQNIQVYRIQRYDSVFTATLVQNIRMPDDTDNNYLAHFNIVFDNKNHFYLYSRNRSTCMGQISKWNIPDPHCGNVYMKEEYMLERFYLSFSLLYAQGGTMVGDKIYFAQGIPSKSDIMFRIVDVNTHEEWSFNLRDYNFTREPEGIMFCQDHFIMTTNRAGIYQLFLNKY